MLMHMRFVLVRSFSCSFLIFLFSFDPQNPIVDLIFVFDWFSMEAEMIGVFELDFRELESANLGF